MPQLHHPCVHPTKVVDEGREDSIQARAQNEPCKEALTSEDVASCAGLLGQKPHFLGQQWCSKEGGCEGLGLLEEARCGILERQGGA